MMTEGSPGWKDESVQGGVTPDPKEVEFGASYTCLGGYNVSRGLSPPLGYDLAHQRRAEESSLKFIGIHTHPNRASPTTTCHPRRVYRRSNLS